MDATAVVADIFFSVQHAVRYCIAEGPASSGVHAETHVYQFCHKLRRMNFRLWSIIGGGGGDLHRGP